MTMPGPYRYGSGGALNPGSRTPHGGPEVIMSHSHQGQRHHAIFGAEDDHMSSSAASSRPVWSTWREIPKVCLYPPHLVRTISIALIVGTVLFLINQLDVVLRGDATTVVWLKSALTYLVPFVVSNLGVLVATRASKFPN
jgi:hypothetical protein